MGDELTVTISNYISGCDGDPGLEALKALHGELGAAGNFLGNSGDA